jgi:hypothetical protein
MERRLAIKGGIAVHVFGGVFEHSVTAVRVLDAVCGERLEPPPACVLSSYTDTT